MGQQTMNDDILKYWESYKTWIKKYPMQIEDWMLWHEDDEEVAMAYAYTRLDHGKFYRCVYKLNDMYGYAYCVRAGQSIIIDMFGFSFLVVGRDDTININCPTSSMLFDIL